MRLALLLCGVACCTSAQTDLQREDVRAIQSLLKNRVHVLARKALDAERWVMVVETTPRPSQIGVFVVVGKTNDVQLVIDRYPAEKVDASPTLELANGHTAYLHFYSDYGFYRGSIKYVFDLAGGRLPRKYPYRILALTSATRSGGRLRYTGHTEHDVIVTIEPGAGDALPGYKIVDARAPAVSKPSPLHISKGLSVVIENTTPPGQLRQPSHIDVIDKSGKKQAYPVPIPTLAQHRKAVPAKQPPGEIENDIGPFVLEDNKVWFANSFYDSEGTSGVGAIGTFDIAARKYEMRYLLEIAPWSGSAMLLDGTNLWIGLMRRPEGSNYGAGLLRYDTQTDGVTKYAVADYIHTIDVLDGTVYCGTSHGLYTIRDGKVTQLRFEPNENGKLAMVAREVR
jgi:hypothetical protein